MRHARPSDLDRLEPFLRAVRNLAGLNEKSRGTFYRGGRAFLHFHAHEGALFADLRRADAFERFPATTPAERKALLAMIAAAAQSRGRAAP